MVIYFCKHKFALKTKHLASPPCHDNTIRHITGDLWLFYFSIILLCNQRIWRAVRAILIDKTNSGDLRLFTFPLSCVETKAFGRPPSWGEISKQSSWWHLWLFNFQLSMLCKQQHLATAPCNDNGKTNNGDLWLCIFPLSSVESQSVWQASVPG